MSYPETQASPEFSKLEEEVLSFWKKENVFQRSVDQRPKDLGGASNEFIFYDGPPFANGLPHYGHLLTGFVKDLFARYQTMLGKRVERRFGWDCHGLPAEMGAEKELGISGRAKIVEYGIEKFNAHCRSSVMQYTQDWEYYVTRQARWVDFQNDYKTMDKNFMESVLWAFKQLYDKGLVYEAFRVMPYSWAAETPLSNFETKMDNSYRDRADPAVTVAFTLKEKPKGAPDAGSYKLLAWTTTPWTLPSNLALAIGKEVAYGCVVKDGVCYILASNAASKYGKELGNPTQDGKSYEANISQALAFDALLGLSYEPLFPYFKDRYNAFKILDGSSFVTDTDGTGVVHMAPGFGEDDQRTCEENGIEIVCPVDVAGRYTEELFDIPGLSLKGLRVVKENKDTTSKWGQANDRIMAYLKNQGALIKTDQLIHSYPHCWRTDEPLIYRALSSWYVEVSKFRHRMVELNQQINWIPHSVRDGIFNNWLASGPDWSISRNRFWGTPIPIWKSASGKLKVFGSIAEIEKASGQKVEDLHRPMIDAIVIQEDGEEYKRIEDVFDCWFESGSMPYGQVHYPFENEAWFTSHSPADFIVEYVGQTRGWFYTLMVLSTALFDKPPFLNCICHGVVLDDKKQKLSKRLGNYADPKWLFDTYGADALRWFMMSSPVMRGQEMYIDKEGKFIRDVVRLAVKPIWNAYHFFTLYANADGVKAQLLWDGKSWRKAENVMDRYILTKLLYASQGVKKALDAYDTPSACQAISEFFEALNNWYIRRSRDRFWKTEKDADKQAAYDTLYTCLHVMCRSGAPLLPLITEKIYQGLTGEESVHLSDFPLLANEIEDPVNTREMDRVREICNAALAIRNQQNLRVRLPLATLTVVAQEYGFSEQFADIIKDEVNVKEVLSSKEVATFADAQLKLDFPKLGARLGDKMKTVTAAVKSGKWKKLEDGRIEAAGEVLEPQECMLALVPKDAYKKSAQSFAGDALAVLDTNVTPELEQEGIARDIVRLIQQTRKDAGLNITDRIALQLTLPPAYEKAVKSFQSYIEEQTLAASLGLGGTGDAAYAAEHELEGEKLKIALKVAA